MDPMLIGAGLSAANTGLGLLLQGHNDRRQLTQQGKLLQQQLGFDFQKMNYQYDKQFEMWQKTNYPEQVNQLKLAGLNPALMYGMSGGGGTTTGAGATGVGSANAPIGGNEILGMQLLNSQRSLIEAQTQKTKAEAEKIAGVDTAEAEKRIESLTQGIENQKAVERLNQIQGNIAEIEEMIKEEGYESILSTIKYTARISEKQLEALELNNEITRETKENKIAIVEGELIGLNVTNELKKSQIKLTEEQTKQTIASVSQGWKKLTIEERNSLTNLANSQIAQENANTNLMDFAERARNNQFGNKIAQEALDLQKFIKDVPESTSLTVSSILDVLRLFKRQRGVIINAK